MQLRVGFEGLSRACFCAALRIEIFAGTRCDAHRVRGNQSVSGQWGYYTHAWSSEYMPLWRVILTPANEFAWNRLARNEFGKLNRMVLWVIDFYLA
jgi:hypothetical protein